MNRAYPEVDTTALEPEIDRLVYEVGVCPADLSAI